MKIADCFAKEALTFNFKCITYLLIASVISLCLIDMTMDLRFANMVLSQLTPNRWQIATPSTDILYATEKMTARLQDIKMERNITLRNKERKEHLKHACAALGFQSLNSRSSLRQHHKSLSHFIVFPKYKLIYCDIPKVSSTSWKRLFLHMKGHLSFQNRLQKKSPHAVARRYFKKLSKLPWDKAKKALESYTSIVFVRNPYTRILSAYRDKFFNISGGQKWRENRAKHWIKNHQSLMTTKRKVFERDWQVSFNEFITYYINVLGRDVHWKDMHKICHPCLVNFSFIGRYETLKEDSEYILDLIHASPEFRFPEPHKPQTLSSRNVTLKRFYDQLSTELMNKLSHDTGLKTDLALFNYRVPDCIKHHI